MCNHLCCLKSKFEGKKKQKDLKKMREIGTSILSYGGLKFLKVVCVESSLYNSFIDASNGIRKAAHCVEKLRHFIDKRAQDGALQFSTTANSIFLLLKYKLNQAILYFFCSSVIY